VEAGAVRRRDPARPAALDRAVTGTAIDRRRPNVIG